MARDAVRARRRPTWWRMGGVAAVAFVGTLAIPAVAALWWSWAAGVAVAAVALIATRRRRVNPGAAAGSGR